LGVTPVLVHHTIKPASRSREPLNLADLAMSGTAEFARQWILLSRREDYQPGTGLHQLWLTAGGSAGQGGLWSLDIDEGTLADDFTGRTWSAAVSSAQEYRAMRQSKKEQEQQEKKAQQDQQDDLAVMSAVDRLAARDEPASYTRVRDLSGLSSRRMKRAVERLVSQGTAQAVPVVVTSGKGRQQTCKGLRRVE
jgi:hypothetical protein